MIQYIIYYNLSIYKTLNVNYIFYDNHVIFIKTSVLKMETYVLYCSYYYNEAYNVLITEYFNRYVQHEINITI